MNGGISGLRALRASEEGYEADDQDRYKVSIGLEFDEERAKALSQDRGLRVLVTNLPGATEDVENIRFGETADTVLRAYLDQYKVEHAFRLAKDGMKMSRVYIHRPSRENAMMFVISLGTMVSDVIGHVLKLKDLDTTTDGIAGRWFTLMFKYDRVKDSEYFDGSDVLVDEFLDSVQELGLDPDHLIHR